MQLKLQMWNENRTQNGQITLICETKSTKNIYILLRLEGNNWFKSIISSGNLVPDAHDVKVSTLAFIRHSESSSILGL